MDGRLQHVQLPSQRQQIQPEKALNRSFRQAADVQQRVKDCHKRLEQLKYAVAFGLRCIRLEFDSSGYIQPDKSRHNGYGPQKTHRGGLSAGLLRLHGVLTPPQRLEQIRQQSDAASNADQVDNPHDRV